MCYRSGYWVSLTVMLGVSSSCEKMVGGGSVVLRSC